MFSKLILPRFLSPGIDVVAWLSTMILLGAPLIVPGQSTNTLVQEDFAGPAGAPPDAARFEWSGQLGLNGSGQLGLSTDLYDQSWLRSLTNATPAVGETLVLQMRAYAYAEGWNPGIYGDGQPRGLRAGTDANNAVEFYSVSRTSVGLRVRNGGVQSLMTFPLPFGVDSMHDYEISLNATSVCFKVDGIVAGTLTTNIPSSALNIYVSTWDGGGVGNVPVSLDSIMWEVIRSHVPTIPAITGFVPANGFIGTAVVVRGTNFTGATAVRFSGVDAAFSVDSDTQITATVPDLAVSGLISVANADGEAASASPFTVVPSPFTYATNSGAITITGYTGSGGAVVIPDTFYGLPVTRIGDYAFKNCSTMTALKIGNNVATIGYQSFYNCSGLTDLTLPNSVTAIGDYGFYYCSGLTSLTIPNRVVSIGNSAFGYGLNMTNVVIGSDVTSIGNYCFDESRKLNAIVVDALNSAYSSVDGVLFNKSATLLVRCPEGKSGDYTVPGGVTAIGNYAFRSCTELSSISLPDSLVSIGDYAFRACWGLTNISLPANVTSLGTAPFYQCGDLTAVTVAELNSAYSSRDGVLFDKSQTTLLQFPQARSGNYAVPDGVTTIGSWSFGFCTSLTRVILPASVTSIQSYGFYYCSTLTRVYLGGMPPAVGSYAFNYDSFTFYYVTGITGGTFAGMPALPWPPPSINSFTPAIGLAGTNVTINGSNFIGVTAVRFNSADAAYAADSEGQLTATVPAAAASGVITVTTPAGVAVSPNLFTVGTLITTCDEPSLNAALSNGGEIIFASDGTIDISTTKMIASDLVLDATGHAVAISGSNVVRVFEVSSGAHLTLRNVTVANGRGSSPGGAIRSSGALTLIDCTFTNNFAMAFGGAIQNQGTLFATNCTFAGNTAGAIQGSAGSAGGGTGGAGGNAFGGGLCNDSGNVTLVNCTFHGNVALGGTGGTGGRGVDGYSYWVDDPWPADGHWVTVPGGPGGRGGDGGNSSGGNFYNASGSAVLINVTLARGSSLGGSGGLPGSPGNYGSGNYGYGSWGLNSRGGNIGLSSGIAALKNTIVAYGTGTPGYNCSGTVVDDGNNLCSDTSAGFSTADSLNATDPLLAANLADNGGPTPTIALLSQSPAINSADNAGAPSTDQRHLPRAGLTDIGALEFQTPASIIAYSWLARHGLPADGSADATDPDGDGMSCLGEWIAGTNPTNATSALRILSSDRVETGLAVSWQSVSGKVYFLQRSADLSAVPAFVTVQSDLPGLPGTTLCIDTNTVGPGPFFYRIGIQR